MKDHPLAFLWAIDGLLSGTRELPAEIQELSVAAGLIPCIVPPREPGQGPKRRSGRTSESSHSALQALRRLAEPNPSIDDPEQVERLLRALEGCLPITATAIPELVPKLREIFGSAEILLNWRITHVEHGGDVGGIMCRIEGDAGTDDDVVVVSITHLVFDESKPCAREIAAYQQHRRERLRLTAA